MAAFPSIKFNSSTRPWVAFHWNIASPIYSTSILPYRCSSAQPFATTSVAFGKSIALSEGRGRWGISSLLLSAMREVPEDSAPECCSCSVPSEHHCLHTPSTLESHDPNWKVPCRPPPFYSAASLAVFNFPTASFIVIWTVPPQPVSFPDCSFVILKAFHLLVTLVFPTLLTSLSSSAPSCLECLE